MVRKKAGAQRAPLGEVPAFKTRSFCGVLWVLFWGAGGFARVMEAPAVSCIPCPPSAPAPLAAYAGRLVVLIFVLVGVALAKMGVPRVGSMIRRNFFCPLNCLFPIATCCVSFVCLSCLLLSLIHI